MLVTDSLYNHALLKNNLPHSGSNNLLTSLRFHNGLTHLWGPRDNEEKLNHRVIRKQSFLMNN